MKNYLIALAATLMIANSANAGGLPLSMPNLQFPSGESVTVGKDCLATDTTTTACSTEQ